MKGRERDDDHHADGSLELCDATAGLFCFSAFGCPTTSGLTCDMLSWEKKNGGFRKGGLVLSTPPPPHFLPSIKSSPTSRMVLLRVRSGLSLRFQRWDLWLRPPSSSLSVVSCLEMRGRLRLRELIRWSDPGSWSLGGGLKKGRSGFRLEGSTPDASASNLQSVSSMSASASLSP